MRPGSFLDSREAKLNLSRLLVEEGLNHLPVVPKSVETPTGATYDGVGFEGRICGVSILRAGEVSSNYLRFYRRTRPTLDFLGNGSWPSRSVQECEDRQDPYPESTIHKIGFTSPTYIFQDEETALPKLFYSKVCYHFGSVAASQLKFALQLPEDVASRYVLLLDPMLGKCLPTYPHLISDSISNGRFCYQGGRGIDGRRRARR